MKPTLVRISIYGQDEDVLVSFIGNLSPQGFRDYRILSDWIQENFPGWASSQVVG